MRRAPCVYPGPSTCTYRAHKDVAVPPDSSSSIFITSRAVALVDVGPRSWYLYECISIIIPSQLLADCVCARVASVREEFLQFGLCLVLSVCGCVLAGRLYLPSIVDGGLDTSPSVRLSHDIFLTTTQLQLHVASFSVFIFFHAFWPTFTSFPRRELCLRSHQLLLTAYCYCYCYYDTRFSSAVLLLSLVSSTHLNHFLPISRSPTAP